MKKYLIPHKHNDYLPHILRERSLVALSVLVVIVFGFALLHSAVLETTDLLSAVYPAVLHELANYDRGDNGVTQRLAWNSVLAQAAELKARDMAEKGYFAHNSPEGKSPWYWFDTAGYEFVHAGENLAVDFADSGDVNRAWMDSTGHRKNILNENFTEIGIAIATGIFNGRETTFVVQMFGAPASSLVAVIPVATPTAEPKPATASVAGAEVETVPATTPLSKTPPFEVVEQSDMFIAVKKAGTTPVAEPVADVIPVNEAQSASFFEYFFHTLFSAPKMIMQIAYLAIGALVVFSLSLSVFMEIHSRHPVHVAYSLSLLFFMAVAWYAANGFLFHTVAIV